MLFSFLTPTKLYHCLSSCIKNCFLSTRRIAWTAGSNSRCLETKEAQRHYFAFKNFGLHLTFADLLLSLSCQQHVLLRTSVALKICSFVFCLSKHVPKHSARHDQFVLYDIRKSAKWLLRSLEIFLQNAQRSTVWVSVSRLLMERLWA